MQIERDDTQSTTQISASQHVSVSAIPTGSQNLQPSTLQPATSSATADSTVQQLNDSATFKRLAALSPLDYDRIRRAEAKRLKLRIETLDNEVAKYRAELDSALRIPHSALADSALCTLHSPDPWPDPIGSQSGTDLLSAISSRFALYLVLPPGAADAMTLWTAHCHAFNAFHLTPRLSLYSPRPGCGKTTAFDVLATMLPRPLRTENISPAVLFRLVHQYQPTLLLDEVDAYLPQSEELRGLLNAGHKRGACAYRCEGEGKAVRAFNAFAPAALAGIGSLPATLHDRSVLVPLVPASDGQIAARFDPLRTETEKALARKLARWAADNFNALAACEPPLPPGAFNRLADNWRPLLAVAQIAGGDWPTRALAAFQHLANPHFQNGSGVAFHSALRTPHFQNRPAVSTSSDLPSSISDLLAKIRQVFDQKGVTRISSKDLAAALDSALRIPHSAVPDSALTDSLTHSLTTPPPPHSLTDSPAHSLSADSQLSTPKLSTAALARLLAPLGLHPRVLRFGHHRARGYKFADFHDAFDHFLEDSQSQRD